MALCGMEINQYYPCMVLCVQVQRALMGDVRHTAGYLMTKSKDLNSQYRDCFSVLQGWRIGDISPNINIVHASGVLGKPKTGKRVLSGAEMVKHKVVS